MKSCRGAKYLLLNIKLRSSMVMWSQSACDLSSRVAAGLYVLQRSTRASITSGKRFHYENTGRLCWLPPVQTLPGLPEGGGVAVGAERGNEDRRAGDSGRSSSSPCKVLVDRQTLLGLIPKRAQFAATWWSTAASPAGFKQEHIVFVTSQYDIIGLNITWLQEQTWGHKTGGLIEPKSI